MSGRPPVLADAIVEYHRVERARKEAAAAALGIDDVPYVPRALQLLERIARACRQAVRTAKKLGEPTTSNAGTVPGIAFTMATAPRHLEVLLNHKPPDRATRAAKHALLTCALALGRAGGGEHEVLFAVARTYMAVARARYRDERLASEVVAIDDGAVARSLLGRAEEKLCAASKALPHFSRGTVQRLLRAARAYTEAWELDRAWAVRAATSRRASRGSRA